MHTSTWDNLCATLIVPLALWIVCCGLGLLAERAAGLRLRRALIAPLGFCAATIVALGVYATGAGNTVAVPVVCVLTIAGFALSRHELPERLKPGWPVLAAVAAYCLFDLSVIASGHWTFTGYNFDNDIAVELLLADNLKAHGTHVAAMPLSTASQTLRSYLDTGYPLGSQAMLAVLSGLLGVSVAVVWQAFISSMAALGVLAASTLSGRTMGARASAAAGLVAVSAALTYQYALQGSIKEIAAAVTVLISLAVIRSAVVGLSGTGAVAVCTIPLAAILATFSAAGLPYAAAIAGSGALAFLAIRRLRPTLDWIRPGLVGVGVLAVAAAPVYPTIFSFLRTATSGYTGSHATAPPLGPLFRVLPLSEVSGVWLYGDYRLPVPPGMGANLTVIATVAILVFGVLGLARAAYKREPGPLMGALTLGLVMAIVYPRAIPYAQAKLLAIGSPILVLVAAQGLTWLSRRYVAPLGIALAGAVAVAILASDVVAYHFWPVAPTQRMIALAQTGQRLAGAGPVLDSEFEEYTKFFTLPAQVWTADPPQPAQLQFRAGVAALYDHSFDLDQQQLPFVESFASILVRRGPASSRPPSNYTLSWQNAYYQVWRRQPRPRVLEHMPLGSFPYSADGPIACRALRAIVSQAPRGSRLVVAYSPPSYGYAIANAAVRSPGWADTGQGNFALITPGKAKKRMTIRQSGLYVPWVLGTLPRTMLVTLDGRVVARLRGNNTPDQWLEGTAVPVAAGRHVLGVTRPGGGTGPGDGGKQGRIGAVTLISTGPERTQAMALTRWKSLCGRVADWVEVVR